HASEVWCVAFQPRGDLVATGALDGTVKLWRLAGNAIADAKQPLRGKHAKAVKQLAFSPDGSRLATASWDQTVKIWNVPTGEEVTILKDHTDRVEDVAFSPTGTYLATASEDRTT